MSEEIKDRNEKRFGVSEWKDIVAITQGPEELMGLKEDSCMSNDETAGWNLK